MKPLHVVLVALGFGLVTQALFWDASLGINFFVFTLIASSVLVWKIGKRALPWMLFAIVSSGSIAMRASDWSAILGVPTTIALFGCMLVSAHERALDFVVSLPSAIVRAAHVLPAVARPESRPAIVRVGLGALLGLPVTGVLAILLAADEGFRGALQSGAARSTTAIGFTIAAVLTALGGLVAYESTRAKEPHANPPSMPPYRGTEPAFATGSDFVLSTLTWSIVLAQASAVFLVFVVVNARHLFGGVRVIRDPGVTYASYLHSGVGELLLAALISIGLVTIGHVLVTPKAERKTRGGRTLAGLEIVLLSLTALTLVSCAERLLMYENAYGTTYKRTGTAVVLVIVTGILIATVCKSSLRHWRGLRATSLAITLGTLALASTFDVDARVARKNLDRADELFDEDYLSSLGPDACAALDHPWLEQHPEVADRLRTAWRGEPSHDLRSHRGIDLCK